MSITRKVILLFAVSVLVPALSSCQQAGKEVGKAVVGSVVGYAVSESLDCAVKGECPNAKAASKAEPDKAIKDYYQLINQRQYSEAWTYLSSRFKNLKPDNNYNNYKEWWNKVNSVTIDSIQLVEKDNHTAIVDALLSYSMKDGRKIDDSSRITLILHSNGKWLIDDKIKN
ncbi:hypothetical protein RIVM261_032710 [Rivularia sp. IAM M-261]|nr:hypothetical protein CAL7716_092580 [Calothrix sp. PCC 7716]GJD18315.1 hypothetical protein RIVM261_032710 [Rivularia sp. IAM M-261]